MQLHPYNLEENKATEWYQPQEYTNYNQVNRISIIPSNEQSSTFFIILSNPMVEEYIIRNRTDLQINIFKYLWKQSKCEQMCDGKLNGQSSVSFVWDTTDIAEKYISI